MRRGVEVDQQLVEIVRRDHPAARRIACERKRLGKRQHRFLASGQGVLVRIGHRELAWTSIDRIAPAQDGMIGLADSAPQPVLAKKRNDVVLIARQRANIHQQWWPAVIGQRGGGKDRTFGAVGHTRLQDAAWRHGRIAVEAEIDWQPVEEGLDLLRRVEAYEQPMLGWRQQRVQPAAISGRQGAKGSEVSDIFCVLHTFSRDSSGTGVLHNTVAAGRSYASWRLK